MSQFSDPPMTNLDELEWQDSLMEIEQVEEATTKDVPLPDQPFIEPQNDEEEQIKKESSIELARAAKEIGNKLFMGQNYDQAILQYSSAIDSCPIEEEFQVIYPF